MTALEALRALESAVHVELERLAGLGLVRRGAEAGLEALQESFHALARSLVPAANRPGRTPLTEAGEAGARLAVFLSGFASGEAGSPARVLEVLFAVAEERVTEAGKIHGDSWKLETPLFAFQKVLAHLARLIVARPSLSGELGELYRINGADLLVYLAFHASRANAFTSGDER